jgi:FMN phosphatase YigB (HAD superfamily)
MTRRVWLFDLDNTLHDASHAAFGPTSAAMTDYMVTHLGLQRDEATSLRQHYWQRYGATLLGLVRCGTLRAGDNAAHKPRKVGVHPCRKPAYVCAKIKSLQALRHLR